MAWLHSTPKQHQKDENPPSRMARIESVGGEPSMPDINPVGYLAGWWQDSGMVGTGAMGPVPLSAVEVQAWAAGMAIHLTPWEFATLREMSRAYLDQSHKSEAPECAAPFGSPSFDREVVDKKLRSIFFTSQGKH